MIEPPPENIIYFYSEYQDTFGEIEFLVPGIQFVQGLLDSMMDNINSNTRNLYIIDDMIGEKDAVIAKLFTKKSHHGNLSVIYIVKNLFHQSKSHRTISLNASYLVLTKNVRHASQMVHLAKQLFPSNTKFFQQTYQMATKEPYTYLFVDHVPTKYDSDPESFRQINILYINLEYKITFLSCVYSFEDVPSYKEELWHLKSIGKV